MTTMANGETAVCDEVDNDSDEECPGLVEVMDTTTGGDGGLGT